LQLVSRGRAGGTSRSRPDIARDYLARPAAAPTRAHERELLAAVRNSPTCRTTRSPRAADADLVKFANARVARRRGDRGPPPAPRDAVESAVRAGSARARTGARRRAHAREAAAYEEEAPPRLRATGARPTPAGGPGQDRAA
jgi:hypothetical protein